MSLCSQAALGLAHGESLASNQVASVPHQDDCRTLLSFWRVCCGAAWQKVPTPELLVALTFDHPAAHVMALLRALPMCAVAACAVAA